MSNFKCEKCGVNILEDKKGSYYTGCLHYPLQRDDLMKELSIYKRAFELAKKDSDLKVYIMNDFLDKAKKELENE